MNMAGLIRTHAKVAGRQRALWFTVIPLTGFATLLALTAPEAPATGGTRELAFTGNLIAIFTGIAYAAAFADFFTAPVRLGMPELEAAAPVRPIVLRGARVLGAFTIVIAPSLAVLLAVALVQTLGGSTWSLPAAVAVTATIVGPAALIAMTLSGLAGALLPRALGRIAAVLVWFYLVFWTPLIPVPTLNGTIFNVIGDTVAEGYFGTSPIYPPTGTFGLDGTPATATVSLAWQFVLIFILLAAGSVLAERAAKR